MSRAITAALCAFLLSGCFMNYYPPARGVVIKHEDSTCYLGLDVSATGVWGTMIEHNVGCQCPDTVRVGDTFTIQFHRP